LARLRGSAKRTWELEARVLDADPNRVVAPPRSRDPRAASTLLGAYIVQPASFHIAITRAAISRGLEAALHEICTLDDVLVRAWRRTLGL
jgi:hypothetical protein